MPKEAEKPNSERAPELPRARLPDTRAAKAVAAILAASIPATSFSRPNEATFINSGNRNSNGETMVQAQAPQGIRAAAEDLSRLSSDPSVSAVVRSGNQNLLLQRANDLMAALDGTGQPYRREVMLGGVRDQRAWSDRYSSLTEEQKLAFRDQAILMMAQNFGEQFSANQAVRINEAFGGVVQQNLESLFAQATAAPAETTMAPGSRPWLESIPIVGSLFRRRGAEEVVPTPVQQPQGEITEDEINSFIASQREAGADFSEFENYRLTLEDVLALTYLDRAYTFFTSTPNPTPEQVLAFYEGVLVAGQMTSRQNGREAATLEDVDRYIQAGLGSVGIGGAASRFLAAITSAETRMVERVAQNLYNYVYERRMAGVSGAPGEIPYERAARAAAQDARQAVQGLFDKIRSVPPEARGALNMNALLAEAGVAQDAMESMLARGSRERLMDMNRLNSIIRSPQFADPNSVRMVLEDGLPKVNIIRGSFTAAFDEAFIAPWRMVSEAWRGESSTLARVINAGGSVFAALTYRPLARGLRTTFGPRRAIGERVGGAAGLAVYGLVGWQVASWLGATERGPFTLAYNSLFGSSGASAPSAGVTAPPRPAVRTEATPALNEAQRDTQQRLVSVSDAYTSINDADPLLGGRISQFLTRAFGFETRTDYGLEANAQRVSRFDAARAQDAAEFMSMASAAMEGKAGNQAELAFYEAFFKFVTGSDNPRTLFIGNRFLPQAQRLDVYRELFDSTRVGRRGSLSNEAEMFEKMRRNPAFISAAGPVAQVIDAAVGAGRAQSASAERYLQMWGIAAGIQAADSTQVAVAFARAYLQNYRGVSNLIDAALEGQDRVNAYVSVLKKLSTSPSMTGDQLEREFLRDQFSRYSNILDAVENYFTDRNAEKQALVYLLGTIRLAASAPGRRPGEVDIENRLMESLSESYPAIRTVMADLAEAFPAAGRRVSFSAERMGLLADIALFMRDNPTAEAGQLSAHFMEQFGRIYSGSQELLATVSPEYGLRFVLKLLPHRPRGTVLPATGTGSIAEYASGTEFWGMRTEAWLREHFQGLSPSERASQFVNLPENLQREYWNANPDERDDLYGAARGNRTWNSEHGEDLKGRRVGRGRRARTVYPEWR